MSDLIIHIQTPGNMILENTVIPGDLLTEQIIDELIDELVLPRRTADGRAVEYVLFSLNQQATLLPDRNLLVSGVENGDTLRLVSSLDFKIEVLRTTGEFASVETSDEDFVEVVLSILDINKTDKIMIELDREVGDVIRQIVHTYILPTRGKFDGLLTYHLTSKALGARLDPSKTLRQEGVPNWDRFSLTREEVAGGGMRLKVDVGASGMFTEKLIWDECTVSFLIEDLVTRLSLERVSSDGAAIRYSLLHGADLSTLPKRKTLAKAGVRNGDTVRLVSDHQPSEHLTKQKSEPRLTEQSQLRAGPRSPSSHSDPVNCTVFAPATIPQGGSCLVQVFTHLIAQADEVKAMAKEFDDETQRRASRGLGIDVEHGATLTFHLLAPGFQVDEPIQKLVWRGSPESVQFGLGVSKDQWLGDFVVTVRVSYDQIPLGHIKFKLEVVGLGQSTEDSGLTGEACIYRKAFVSYASQDRVEVLKRVQMLVRLGVNVFQDVISQDPGQRWKQLIYRHIDESDLFLLFWSSAAKNSQWVMKEVRYALWLKKGDDQAPPEIVPIIIEGPPIVPPPDELAHLHFNDQFLYFISGSQLDVS